MNYCKECGKILEDEQKECPFCGANLEETKFDNEYDSINNTQKQSFDTQPTEQVKETFHQEEYNPEIKHDYVETSNPEYSYSSMGVSSSMDNSSYHSPQSEPLSNWVKVLLPFCAGFIMGIGPIVGIVCSIIFMNNDDPDRKSFGQALLTVSIGSIVLFCICCMLGSFSGILEEFSSYY